MVLEGKKKGKKKKKKETHNQDLSELVRRGFDEDDVDDKMRNQTKQKKKDHLLIN